MAQLFKNFVQRITFKVPVWKNAYVDMTLTKQTVLWRQISSDHASRTSVSVSTCIWHLTWPQIVLIKQVKYERRKNDRHYQNLVEAVIQEFVLLSNN